jgi:phage repressor protein C with HTH and peptisase S24 domain
MKLLSERLAWAIKYKANNENTEIKAADVARAGSTSNAAVSFWLADANGMSAIKARPIAAYLGVSSLWLETGEGRPVSESQLPSEALEIIELILDTDRQGRKDVLRAAQDAFELRSAHLDKLAHLRKFDEYSDRIPPSDDE